MTIGTLVDSRVDNSSTASLTGSVVVVDATVVVAAGVVVTSLHS